VRHDFFALANGATVSGATSLPLFSRRTVIWGSAWGIGVGVVEFLGITSIENWGSWQQLSWWLLYWMMPFWCVVGMLFVWLADRWTRGGKIGEFIVCFLALSFLAASLQPPLSEGLTLLTRQLFPPLERFAREVGTIEPNRQNWAGLSLFHVWATCFYGAMLVIAYSLTVRSARIRSLLFQSAMSRSRTETLLDAERLQALQSQIDPHLLLDSMQELEHRYRVDPERAERLLETLVDFLRHAMHGLRMPVSTINAELRLAQAFAQLQRERGVQGAWRVIEDTTTDDHYKFPSLLMLPLLALGGEGGRPLMRIRAESGQTVLSMHGLMRDVSDDLRQTIRARLYTLYGDRFQFDTPLSSLAITLKSA
jgi:hypothetical protein